MVGIPIVDKNCFDWAKIGSSLDVNKNAGGAETSYIPHQDSDIPFKIEKNLVRLENQTNPISTFLKLVLLTFSYLEPGMHDSTIKDTVECTK